MAMFPQWYRAMHMNGQWYVTQVTWDRAERENLQTVVNEGTVVLYADSMNTLEDAIGDKYTMVKAEDDSN